MKVSLNSKFIDGSYGGGMKFANYLRDYLEKSGVSVVNNLSDDNIDIILHISPFPFISKSSSYSFFDAFIYKLKHPNVVIIQRVNECDERKGSGHINKLLVKASKYSDFVVFIASWLKPLLENQGMALDKSYRIILNGADEKCFNLMEKKFWDKKEKLKIITHHWSNNYMKGHDVYQKLDGLLNDKEFSEKFDFTYIGNIPKNLVYKNSKILSPISGIELANEIKKHHIYLTATRNEPAGMHHVEGALCGLPILYINSGALSEYCGGFGLEFNIENFEEKLYEIRRNYDFWVDRIKNYNNTAKKMSAEYLNLFIDLYENRGRFYKKVKAKCFKIWYYKIYSIIYYFFWKVIKKI